VSEWSGPHFLCEKNAQFAAQNAFDRPSAFQLISDSKITHRNRDTHMCKNSVRNRAVWPRGSFAKSSRERESQTTA
jgi:hypothetical protein